MAASQLARGSVAETVAEFMERRRREVARRDQAEAAGRDAWATSTTTGQSWSAPRTADVVALGARLLGGQATPDGAAVTAARPSQRHASAPVASRPAAGPRKAFGLSTQRSQAAGSSYGNLYAPPADDLPELRRQQAEFARVTREIDKQNSWFAIPALAPVAAVLGLEGAGAVIAGSAVPQLRRLPLVLEKRMPHLRVGDNWSTRAGRRAHKAMEVRVNAKPGWDGEQGIATKNGLVRPDVRAPSRTPDPGKRFQMELKPDTPTGRRAGAKAVERYTKETGNKTRAIYYDPKDFM